MTFEIKHTSPIIDKDRYQNMIDEALAGSRKISTQNLSLDQWLSLRTMLGIGGSEVAAVLGMNPYQTAFSVWKSKVSDEISHEENDFMTFGNLVEPALIEWYNKKKGFEKNPIRRAVKDKFIRIHPEHDCLFVNLDGVVYNEDGSEEGLVECKSTSYRAIKAWANDEEDCAQGIPLYMYCQVQHELSITGLPWCDLAILITDNRELKILRILRDEEYIQKQNEALVLWYSAYVIPMIAPPYAASEIAKLEPEEGSFAQADEEAAQLCVEYKAALAEFSAAEKKKDFIKDQIICKIGDKEHLVFAGSTICTYKQQSRAKFDDKALKNLEPEIHDRFLSKIYYRVLRVIK